MAMDERGLGKLLQKARQHAGLTQQQLCSKANLSFSTLTKIERGAIKSPSIFTIQSIADALELGLDELVGHSISSQKKLKTKSGASFIYFDVNGCLIHFYQRAFDKLAQDTGVSSESAESAYWHYNDQACRGDISIGDFNNKLSARLGVDNLKWQNYYLDSIEPIKEMQELLVWAAERYRVGLLTNIMPGLLSSIRHHKLLPDLNYDVIVDSSEVGTMKPEARIYEIAQDRSGFPPDEIIFIDDNRANIMAAERLGWHVLSFDDTRPKEAVERVRKALEPAN
jgi:epoxide hydrolase-like predicted phosphatase